MSRLILIAIIFVLASSVFSEGFVNDFLRMDTDIRSSGMGSCNIASTGAAALFGNPAYIGIGDIAFIGHERLYDGLLIADAAGLSLNFVGPGNFAIGAIYVGGGGIEVTGLPNPAAPISAQNRPYVISEKGHHDFALVPGYSIPVGKDLRIGAAAGAVYRHNVDDNAFGVSFRAGAGWSPIQNLDIGAVVGDASYISWNTGTSEIGAPSFSVGSGYEAVLGAGFGAMVCAEGSYSIQEKLFEGFAGIELSYKELFAIRGGFNNHNFTAGADLRIFDGLRAGASLSIHEDLPISYRIGLSLREFGKVLNETDEIPES